MRFLVFILLIFTPVKSLCPDRSICKSNLDELVLTCDGTFLTSVDNQMFPNLTCFPAMKDYLFYNIPRFRPEILNDLVFRSHERTVISLINVTRIETGSFSNQFRLGTGSSLHVIIGNPEASTSITIEENAFNRIKIERLKFSNINRFNGRPVFETNTFGDDADIEELIFDGCGLTGFSNTIKNSADVEHLSIMNTPALTQITDLNLPSFLSTTRTLKISNTSLAFIKPYTFQAWLLFFEELILTDNSKLITLPQNIVAGVLMKLKKLDLSGNSIRSINPNYEWFPYSYTKELSLRSQSLDLFLQSRILHTLDFLERIDFSYGVITANETNLIDDYFPKLSNLSSIDLSYTNMNESILIEVLKRISDGANHFINIYLNGYQLSEQYFCSYLEIFKKAPNLLKLHLDSEHRCNCIIDLFNTQILRSGHQNSSLLGPMCLLEADRVPCDLEAQSLTSKCNIAHPNPDSTDPDGQLGNYAFGGIVAGVSVLVFILVALGFTAVYKIRRRRSTILDMEQPVENPLTAIIEERLQRSL